MASPRETEEAPLLPADTTILSTETLSLRRPGVSLCFRDVCVVQKHWYEKEAKILIQGAVGYFPSGSLNVVCGVFEDRRTLLKTLAGGVLPQSGTLTANRIPVASHIFRRIVGFVKGDFSPIQEFTARQNVEFSLNLRQMLGDHFISSRVNESLEIVGLSQTLKGSDMSAYHRLCLNIAIELAIDPPAIFLEDPFTGLDVHHNNDIMKILLHVSRILGKTVVCSVSDLPHNVFESIDNIVVLGKGGHTLYSGEREHSLLYFSGLELPLDSLAREQWNDGEVREVEGKLSAPDLGRLRRNSSVPILGRSGRSPNTRLEKAQSEFISSFKAAAEEGEEILVVDTGDGILDVATLWGESKTKIHFYAAKFYDSVSRANVIEQQDTYLVQDSALLPSPSSEYIIASDSSLLRYDKPNSFLRFGRLFLGKAHQSLLRRDFYVAWILLFILVGLIALLMSKQEEDQQGMQNIRGIVFFTFLLSLECNKLFIPSWVQDISVYEHQHSSGFYSTLTYLTVFVCHLLAVRTVYLATIASVVFVAVGSVNDFLTLILAVSIAHAMFVYLMTLMTRSEKLATYICYGVDAYTIIFSGFLINITTVPGFFSDLSILRFGFGATLVATMEGKDYGCPVSNRTITCFTGDQTLQDAGFSEDTPSHSFNILIGLVVVLIFAAFGFMKARLLLP